MPHSVEGVHVVGLHDGNDAGNQTTADGAEDSQSHVVVGLDGLRRSIGAVLRLIRLIVAILGLRAVLWLLIVRWLLVVHKMMTDFIK